MDCRGNRNPFFLAQRQQVAFEGTEQKIVSGLHGIDAAEVLELSAAQSTGNPVRRPVGNTDIASQAVCSSRHVPSRCTKRNDPSAQRVSRVVRSMRDSVLNRPVSTSNGSTIRRAVPSLSEKSNPTCVPPDSTVQAVSCFPSIVWPSLGAVFIEDLVLYAIPLRI